MRRSNAAATTTSPSTAAPVEFQRPADRPLSLRRRRLGEHPRQLRPPPRRRARAAEERAQPRRHHRRPAQPRAPLDFEAKAAALRTAGRRAALASSNGTPIRKASRRVAADADHHAASGDAPPMMARAEATHAAAGGSAAACFGGDRARRGAGARADPDPGGTGLRTHAGGLWRRGPAGELAATCRTSTRSPIRAAASSRRTWTCAAKAAAQTMRQLLETADVFIQGYRPHGDRRRSVSARRRLPATIPASSTRRCRPRDRKGPWRAAARLRLARADGRRLQCGGGRWRPAARSPSPCPRRSSTMPPAT